MGKGEGVGTRRDWLKLAAGSASMAMLSGCTWLFAKETVRYRITVVVDTPRGPASGSAVWQVRFVQEPTAVVYTEGTGEAFPIDLPNGQTIFALIAGDLPNPYNLIDRIIRERIKDIGSSWWQKDYEEIVERWKMWSDQWVIPIDDTHDRPALVRFRDVNDPSTMEFLDPRNLDAVMGSGVLLRGIGIQLTHERVSRGIEERLPWLENGTLRNFDLRNLPQEKILGGFTPTFRR